MSQLAGRSVSLGANPDDLREALMGKLGDSNFQKDGIGLGRVEGGHEPHALGTEYVSFWPTDGTYVYTLSHGRKVKPGLVRKAHVEHPLHPEWQYIIDGYSRDTWDHTKIHVNITPVGSAQLSGVKATVEIGGTS